MQLKITNHLKDFKCSMCGTCCKRHWRITLDPERIKDYQRIASTDDFFAENFKYITVDEQHMIHDCKLLRGDNSCYLHAKYGLEMLSSVCQSYPRFFIRTKQGVEGGLSYACPTSVSMLKTPFAIETIHSEQFDFPLPYRMKEFEFPESYYQFERCALSILAGGFDDDTFRLLESSTPNQKIFYPAFDVLLGRFSKYLLQFVGGVFQSKYSLEQLQEVEGEVDELLSGTPILSGYFSNFIFTKSFYPQRELVEDTVFMMAFVYQLIRFQVATSLLSGAIANDALLSDAIVIVERDFIHKSGLCAKSLVELSDWY